MHNTRTPKYAYITDRSIDAHMDLPNAKASSSISTFMRAKLASLSRPGRLMGTTQQHSRGASERPRCIGCATDPSILVSSFSSLSRVWANCVDTYVCVIPLWLACLNRRESSCESDGFGLDVRPNRSIISYSLISWFSLARARSRRVNL
jgi:hypothetical protein